MHIFWYALSKLAAAALTMLLFIIAAFVNSDFRLSDLHDHVSMPLLWGAFFGYGYTAQDSKGNSIMF